MAEISIGNNHLAYLARVEHLGEWLQREEARLEAELAYVRGRGQALTRETQGFLLQSYGVAPGQEFTLDTDRGLIITPGPLPPDAPTQDTPDDGG